jgi:purine nucleoside phosphorylase
MVRISVIYGTGMINLPILCSEYLDSSLVSLRCETEWGNIPLTLISENNFQISFLYRHHSANNQVTPPHSIEHRGNIRATASTSPDIIVSINSVGSISSATRPGDIALTSDIIDFADHSWSFHDIMAFHSDRTSLFDSKAVSIIKNILDVKYGINPENVIVAQCSGPQFETPAEINALEKLGADVVNMTLGPESRLISELSIPHLSVVCSSNWAAGRNPQDSEMPIDHEEVKNISSSMENLIIDCINSLINNYSI